MVFQVVDIKEQNLSIGRTIGFQIDAMIEPLLYERFMRQTLEEALEDTLVALIHFLRGRDGVSLIA